MMIISLKCKLIYLEVSKSTSRKRYISISAAVGGRSTYAYSGYSYTRTPLISNNTIKINRSPDYGSNQWTQNNNISLFFKYAQFNSNHTTRQQCESNHHSTPSNQFNCFNPLLTRLATKNHFCSHPLQWWIQMHHICMYVYACLCMYMWS